MDCRESARAAHRANPAPTSTFQRIRLRGRRPWEQDGAKRCTCPVPAPAGLRTRWHRTDRKSTRLNSSHLVISYAVFCLKKKKKDIKEHSMQLYTDRIWRHTHLGTL